MIQAFASLKRIQASLPGFQNELASIRRRLLLLVLYETTTNASLVGVLERRANRLFPSHVKATLRQLLPDAIGYQALLAHDSGIELAANSKDDVCKHLAHCLIAFWRGMNGPAPLGDASFDAQLAHGISLARSFPPTYGEEPRILDAMRELRASPKPQDGAKPEFVRDRRSGDARHVLGLNVLAAHRFGDAIRRTYEVLREVYPADALAWHPGYALRCLLMSGAMQINTLEQRDPHITWRRYREIAIGKSNVFLDLAASVRLVPDATLFEQWRHNSAQFCEQFYLDDLIDFEEDGWQGICNGLHVFLLEQGRLARALAALPTSSSWTDADDRHAVVLVQASGLVDEKTEDGIFLHSNPYVVQPRSTDGALAWIRTALCNRHDETTWGVEQLCKHRRAESDALLNALTYDRSGVTRALLRSNVPRRFQLSFVGLARRSMPIWREAGPGYAEWIRLYLLAANAMVWTRTVLGR